VLTLISGVLSALSGVLWFFRHSGENFSVGQHPQESELTAEAG
jgi:hypothetical protein